MPRIRTIKPEFPLSQSLGRVSRDARLAFVNLWTIVDDSGRTRAASRMLASLLFPYDDDAPGLIDGWLAELAGENMIKRYTIDGDDYLEIVNWLKHQKIDRPTPSKLPPPSRALASPREPSRMLAPDLGPRTLDQEGKERKIHDANASCAKSLPLASAASQPDPEPEIAFAEPIPPTAMTANGHDLRDDPDPKRDLFRSGLAWLAQATGRPAVKLRPMLGRWCKARGDPETIAAIVAAQRENPVEPIAWIEARLNAKSRKTDAEQRRDQAAAFLDLGAG